MAEKGLEGLSVCRFARRYAIGSQKVLGFIRRGELIAVNVATNAAGRPQWRITAESVAHFERVRASKPPSKKPRRRVRPVNVDYYPD